MNKILLSARDLEIGGIEKSLVTLINYLCEKNYDVTLILEQKKGVLLGELDSRIKIIEYTPNTSKIIVIRKLKNLLKKIKFIINYKNKFDTAISFATYSKSGSFVARVSSKNSVLWCHADYLSLYEGDRKKVKQFFEELQYDKFSKIVFVSKRAQKNFLEIFPKQKNTYYCNNLIDYKKIYEQTKEKIELNYVEKQVTFLNVGRHDEKQKKLSRIIKAAMKLKQEKYDFRIIFVGDGKDTGKYKKIVEKYNLKNNIIFVGSKVNPYPYYKIANCMLLSSDYEGYPVVFLESFILNKPIITTDVSDYEDIQNKNGIVTKKDVNSIYGAMKKFIQDGYVIKYPFDIRKYNEEVKENLKLIIN